ESPLPFACLLSRVILIVPRLLIRGPQREKMVDDHEYFVGDGQRRLLLTDTYFETPKGAPQEGGRFPSAPGTLHQDPAEVAIPLTRFASVPFPGTLMVPWTDAGPRRQARGVSKPAHIRPNLGDDVPCRNDIHSRNAIELRDLLLQRSDQLPDLLIDGGNLPIQHLNQLQQQGEQGPMMRRELARQGEFQLRALVLQRAECQGR